MTLNDGIIFNFGWHQQKPVSGLEITQTPQDQIDGVTNHYHFSMGIPDTGFNFKLYLNSHILGEECTPSKLLEVLWKANCEKSESDLSLEKFQGIGGILIFLQNGDMIEDEVLRGE